MARRVSQPPQQPDAAERHRSRRALEVLYNVSLACRSSSAFEPIFNAVYRELREVFPLDACYIAVCDTDRPDTFRAVLLVDEDFHEYREGRAFGTLTGLLVHRREPLLFGDLSVERAQLDSPPAPFGNEQKRSCAWLGVPLLVGRDALGVISIQSYQANLYDHNDRDLLQQLGNMVAVALENVSLDQQERELRAALAAQVRARTEQLAALSAVAAEMVLQHPLPVLLDRALSRIIGLLRIEGGAVRLLDAPREQLTLQAQRGMPEWYVQDAQSLTVAESPLGRVVIEDRPLVITSGLPVHTRAGIAPPFESLLGVPLRSGGRIVGTLSLVGAQAHLFDAQQIDLAQAIGNQIAIAIENARLFAEREQRVVEAQQHATAAKRQAHKMELVQRIAALLSSRLDEQAIFDLAVHELVGLFQADHTGIVLFDESDRWGTLVADHPRTEGDTWPLPLTDNPLIDELRASHRPVCVTSIATDPRARAIRDELMRDGIVSLMLVPLVSRGRVIGSIGVDSLGHERVFSDEEQELFLTIATAVAAALDNARLFAAEQSARRTADTLREVARVLSSSFDPNEVLQLVLRELQKVVPYDTASIGLLEGQHFHITASRGWEELVGTRHHHSFSFEQRSAAGLVIRRREPLVIADTHASPDWSPDPTTEHIRSWLGVPLIAKGRVLGVLNIDACRPNRFTPLDAEAALAFANQAALALENAQLYDDAVTRVERELSLARDIQSNLFPSTLPTFAGLTLAARCLPAHETGGDFYDLLPLGAAGEAPLLAVMVGDASGKSIPGAMLMAIAHSVARSEASDHRSPDTVLRETGRWVAQDVPPRSFVALCYATLDSTRGHCALANAGQLAPLLRRADGSLAYLEVPGPTLPLGIQGHTAYEALDVWLEAGDTLVFYTDGIVEAHNQQRELFGFERLEALVEEQGDLPPEQVIDRVIEAISDFIGGAHQHDDMTMVVVRWEGFQGRDTLP